ncbi:MAG: hypothetical protein LBP92_09375 [Deltaproteobacteria bacterium]|nr:hypothetical protein [Deltaproteobacteria bacterium]
MTASDDYKKNQPFGPQAVQDPFLDDMGLDSEMKEIIRELDEVSALDPGQGPAQASPDPLFPGGQFVQGPAQAPPEPSFPGGQFVQGPAQAPQAALAINGQDHAQFPMRSQADQSLGQVPFGYPLTGQGAPSSFGPGPATQGQRFFPAQQPGLSPSLGPDFGQPAPAAAGPSQAGPVPRAARPVLTARSPVPVPRTPALEPSDTLLLTDKVAMPSLERANEVIDLIDEIDGPAPGGQGQSVADLQAAELAGLIEAAVERALRRVFGK